MLETFYIEAPKTRSTCRVTEPSFISAPGRKRSSKMLKLSDKRGRYTLATSTGQRNILFSNYREGDVGNEAKTEDLLFRSR